MGKFELPQGTLDLLVLQVLNGGEMHGWGIAQKLNVLSKEMLQLQEGTLYPALYRMEAKGWIESEGAQPDKNRRAKYYRVPKVGRKRLEGEKDDWDRIATLVSRVLDGA